MASLIPFTKRFESSENLVNLLESRGLQICDRNKAIQYLDNIGYYRLSAYMYPLLKIPKTAHLYKEGSTFKKVMMLYRFDKKLRLLMFNEIEKIENIEKEEIQPVKRRRGRPPKKPIESPVAEQPKRKRGRPPKVKPVEEQEETTLPGFEDSKEETILPGFENSEEETTLPGFENSEEETTLPGFEDSEEETTLPGFEDS